MNNTASHDRDSIGARVERRVDTLVRSVSARPLGAVALGAALASAAVLGGLSAFILVWAVLVGVLHR